MNAPRVLRYTDAGALAADAATILLERLIDLQEDGTRAAQLCLTGGRIANSLYERLAEIVAGS